MTVTQGICMFSAFQNVYIILHSHQQCVKIFSISSPTLGMVNHFNACILINMWEYSFAVFICISLTSEDGKDFFMYFFVIMYLLP